jgi:hypothetical protein
LQEEEEDEEGDPVDGTDSEEDEEEEEGEDDSETVHANPYLQLNQEMDNANIFDILAKKTDKDRQNKVGFNGNSFYYR